MPPMPSMPYEWVMLILVVLLVILAVLKLYLLTQSLNTSDKVLELAKGWFTMAKERHEDTQKVAEAISKQATSAEKIPEIVQSIPETTATKVVEKIKEERGDSSPGFPL